MPLPILPGYGDSYHPSSDWAKTLDKKKKVWLERQPLDERYASAIEQWTLTEWVYGALQSDHPHLTREHIALQFPTLAPDKESDLTQISVHRFYQAIKALRTRASVLPLTERDALNKDDLLTFYRLLTGQSDIVLSGMFRKDAGTPQIETHQPATPQAVPILLDMALDWFTTDSFAELHPVEQASLFHLRLLDLQPFALHNTRLVRLLASFYLLRADLPPLLFVPEEGMLYQEVIGYAFQMITQPSVEVFSQMLLRTFDQWERLVTER